MVNDIYTGYKELELTDDQFVELYTDGRIQGYDFKENEYLLAKNTDGEVVDHLVNKKGKLIKIPYQTLNNSYLGKIKVL